MVCPAQPGGASTYTPAVRDRPTWYGEGMLMCATYVVVNCKVGELHRHGDQKNGTIDNAFFKILFQVHKLFQSINRTGYPCPQTHHTVWCRHQL